MKRILLVQGYQGRKEPGNTIFPLGLCYIATALAVKHEVAVFDPNTCEGDPYAELSGKVAQFKPDVVGLSVRNIDTLNKRDIFYYYKTAPVIIKLIKEKAPSAKVVVGGSGFSIFAREIMERVPEIDFGVYLEGEETFPELLDKMDEPREVPGVYYRHDGVVAFTGTRPLPEFKSLPIPRRDFVDIKRYSSPIDTVGIQTKRGCPLRCAYCSYPFLNGNRLRLRRPSEVVDEIEYLVNEFGVRQFMFVDGVFNVPEKHAEEICREILGRDLDVEWSAWCEIKHFSEKFVSLARQAGCRKMPFSPDAASDEALYSLGKDISTRDIDNAVRLIKGHKDIEASFGFFCTPPGQTYMGLLKTIYSYFRINAALWPKGGATLGWIRIEPHTRIQQIAIEEGLIGKDDDLLPETEEGLKGLYYSSRAVWPGDMLTVLVLAFVNAVLKPGARSVKKMLRALRSAIGKPQGGAG